MKSATSLASSSLATRGILLAAVGGLVTGCAESAKPTKESASAKPTSTTMAHDKSDKNCCVGKNDCKGKGGCGGDGHDCAGKNDCKGKGGCSMRDCTAAAASSAKP